MEGLIGGLQVELRRLKWPHYAHCHSHRVVVGTQVKGDCVGALVDDLLIFIPKKGDMKIYDSSEHFQIVINEEIRSQSWLSTLPT